MMGARPLIVGEAPGFFGEDSRPLEGKAGERLAHCAGVDGYAELVERFDIVNLLDYFPGRQKRGKGAAFPLEEARPRAAEILAESSGPIIVLGKRAGEAFGLSTEYFEWSELDGTRIVVVPHPSAINRWWNDASNYGAAIAFWTVMALHYSPQEENR